MPVKEMSTIFMVNRRESFSNLLRMTVNNQGNTKVRWTIDKEVVLNVDGTLLLRWIPIF